MVPARLRNIGNGRAGRHLGRGSRAMNGDEADQAGRPLHMVGGDLDAGGGPAAGGALFGIVQPGKGAGDTGQGERSAEPGVVPVVQEFQHPWGDLGAESGGRSGSGPPECCGPGGGEWAERVGSRAQLHVRDGEAYRETVQEMRRDQLDVLGAADGQPAGAGPPSAPQPGVLDRGRVGSEELDGGAHPGHAEPGQIGHDDERGAGSGVDERPGFNGEFDAVGAPADSGP